MTFHRFLCTALPFTACSYLSKLLLQVILVGIFLFFLSSLSVLNTELAGVLWVDSYMTWGVKDNASADVYELLNHISNYGVGLINLVAYSCLFALLYRRRLLSFSRNREIKMTLQVLCMVVCEVLFLLYWEFLDTRAIDSWSIVIAETINLLFFDITILPYLIFNRFVFFINGLN
ncbi:hypothetical protein Y032_0020g70 [Ancylostoma ceylanicum]|nr:hypothetical protein Y032_0020g70 [Ancylostoma ceylanicum]